MVRESLTVAGAEPVIVAKRKADTMAQLEVAMALPEPVLMVRLEPITMELRKLVRVARLELATMAQLKTTTTRRRYSAGGGSSGKLVPVPLKVNFIW